MRGNAIVGDLLIACLAMAGLCVQAAEPTRAATEGSTVPYPFPVMDTANALSGRALLDALRRGGYVLFMRHTETGTVTQECEKSNLTPRGERDARFVGDSIGKLKVPLDRVLSSPVCRVRDTALQLGLGAVEITTDLSNVPAKPDVDLDAVRARRIAAPPPAGKNTLLVSHMHGGKEISQAIYLDFGEIIVYKPMGSGRANAVARIRADDWYQLKSMENPR